MDKKKVFQYGLLILLIISSFLFYYQYFAKDVKKANDNKLEDISKTKNSEVAPNNENSNVIDNLKYVSEDLLGNTYTVTAQSATLKKNKINEVQLS